MHMQAIVGSPEKNIGCNLGRLLVCAVQGKKMPYLDANSFFSSISKRARFTCA
jgi:hypothetical protein